MKAGIAIMLLGSIFLPHDTVYRWQSYSVTGDTLYAVKTVSSNAINIPIPERGATKVLEKEYEVVAIDLTGKKNEAVRVKHRLYPEHPIGGDHLDQEFGYYEYIESVDNAPPVLWGNRELKERLLRAGGVDCAEREIGPVIYDRQDSRVLYLYCKKTSVAYRTELPSMRSVAIPLGAAAGLPPGNEPKFFSTLGQKKVFVRLNREFYELEIASNDKAKKIEYERPAKNLIGVADGLRIYQLTQVKEKTTQLSVEFDQKAPRIFSLPAALARDVDLKARYLPRNNLMMWEVYGEAKGKVAIYTLSLDSGVMRRVEVTDVE